MLQINSNFCADFDDAECLPAVWVDTAKIMSLSNQVFINCSGDQNGFLGQNHKSCLWRNFCSLLQIFSKLLFSSM